MQNVCIAFKINKSICVYIPKLYIDKRREWDNEVVPVHFSAMVLANSTRTKPYSKKRKDTSPWVTKKTRP